MLQRSVTAKLAAWPAVTLQRKPGKGENAQLHHSLQNHLCYET